MPTDHFTWYQLHLSAPVDPARVRSTLVGLASLPGNPRIVCEALGQSGRVSWRVGADVRVIRAVLEVLGTHLPDVGTTPSAASAGTRSLDVLSTAASLHLPGSDRLPLRHEATEPVTRSLLAALSATKPDELIRVQLILGPRLKPRRMNDIDPIERRAVALKLSEHGFGCALRIAAQAGTDGRAHHLVSQVGASLRGLEVPRVSVRLRRTSARTVVTVSSPWCWPLWLRVSDLVPLLGWPTAEPPLPGVPDRHPRQLAASVAIPRTGRILGRSSADENRSVALTVDDSLRHLHVLGPTGVGKSTLMASLALQDIEAGRGVVVIDPKGDLVDDIASRVPPQRLDDLVILDARDEAPVGLNGLAGHRDPDLAADTLLSVFHSLYADSWGPRTHDILHACLLSLARRAVSDDGKSDVSLAMVPLLLTNPGFRRSVVGRAATADPMGLGSFWAWFEAISDAERTQAIAPLMNKLRPVLMRPGLRAVFGQRRPQFGVEDVFTPTETGQGRILLVSLSKGSLGPEAARLLGSIVVALVWQAALGRVGVPSQRRHPVMVHIDEVQDYLRLPGDLSDALTQARGLGVGFTLAHQHLGQLPRDLRLAVMANARSRLAFSLSPDDAKVIAATTSGVLESADYRALPAFMAYGQLLSGGTTQPPFSVHTAALGPALRSVDRARAHSRDRYGQPLGLVEQDLLGLTGLIGLIGLTAPTDPAAGSSAREESLGRRRGPSSRTPGDVS